MFFLFYHSTYLFACLYFVFFFFFVCLLVYFVVYSCKWSGALFKPKWVSFPSLYCILVISVQNKKKQKPSMHFISRSFCYLIIRLSHIIILMLFQYIMQLYSAQHTNNTLN